MQGLWPPPPVLFPALTHRNWISGSSGGWKEVNMGLSIPLRIQALSPPGLPSVSPPTPLTFSTWWGPAGRLEMSRQMTEAPA